VTDGILQFVVQPAITGIFAVIVAWITTHWAKVGAGGTEDRNQNPDRKKKAVFTQEISSRAAPRRELILAASALLAVILAVLALIVAIVDVNGGLGLNKIAGGVFAAVAAAGALISGIVMNRRMSGTEANGQEGTAERKSSRMKTGAFVWIVAPLAGVAFGLGLLGAGVNPVVQAVVGPGPVPLKAPFAVNGYFYASGFMGEDIKHIGEHIQLNAQWTGNCHPGPTCMRFQYLPQGSSWAGVYWLSPANNWGDQPGRKIEGAKELVFWVRGESGGEVVSFKVGGIQGKKYQDTLDVAMDPSPIKLTTQWQQYQIDLKGADTSSVIGAFAWSIATDGNPQGATFYLDGIRIE
jgi:hypothetical protein